MTGKRYNEEVKVLKESVTKMDTEVASLLEALPTTKTSKMTKGKILNLRYY